MKYRKKILKDGQKQRVGVLDGKETGWEMMDQMGLRTTMLKYIVDLKIEKKNRINFKKLNWY